jgi:hypothetical protein
VHVGGNRRRWSHGDWHLGYRLGAHGHGGGNGWSAVFSPRLTLAVSIAPTPATTSPPTLLAILAARFLAFAGGHGGRDTRNVVRRSDLQLSVLELGELEQPA